MVSGSAGCAEARPAGATLKRHETANTPQMKFPAPFILDTPKTTILSCIT
jgi:hypothetical protein